VKNKWVFVWMGDPAEADPALLPDNFSCDSPEWDYLPGYLHYSTPQQLICDNLLDFSHLSYVHEKTLGGTTAIAQARAEIESVPRGIRVTRRCTTCRRRPTYRAGARAVRQPRPLVRLRLPPARHAADAFGRPARSPTPRTTCAAAVRLHSCQTVTPETETTTHYFFQQSRRVEEGSQRGRRGALQGAARRLRGRPGDDHGAEPGDRRRPRMRRCCRWRWTPRSCASGSSSPTRSPPRRRARGSRGGCSARRADERAARSIA
jgi:vanillate O-demethylase monooxygenase subunit